MFSLKKYVKLHHTFLSNLEIGALIVFIVFDIMPNIFYLIDVRAGNANGIELLEFTGVMVNYSVVFMMILLTFMINANNFSMFTIFSVTRRKFYYSEINYFIIINLIFSLYKVICDWISHNILSLNKYNSEFVLVKEFVFYFFIFLILSLLINCLIMYIKYYKARFIEIGIAILVLFVQFEVYVPIFTLIKNLNEIIIYLSMISVIAILIVLGWRMIRKVDIVKSYTFDEDEENNKIKEPFQGNYIQFTIANIRGLISGVVFIICINYFWHFLSLDLEGLLWLCLGSMTFNTLDFWRNKRRLRR
ncbi:hypothetical protein [Clostridium sp. DL1XJH146]